MLENYDRVKLEDKKEILEKRTMKLKTNKQKTRKSWGRVVEKLLRI